MSSFLAVRQPTDTFKHPKEYAHASQQHPGHRHPDQQPHRARPDRPYRRGPRKRHRADVGAVRRQNRRNRRQAVLHHGLRLRLPWLQCRRPPCRRHGRDLRSVPQDRPGIRRHPGRALHGTHRQQGQMATPDRQARELQKRRPRRASRVHRELQRPQRHGKQCLPQGRHRCHQAQPQGQPDASPLL